MGAEMSMASVQVGDEIGPVSIPVTLQRLVMEAGANRDFSLIHHNGEVARATGAPDAYMNTFFIAGMFERLLREWMGPRGRLKKIVTLRMKTFNAVGDTVNFHGRVTAKDAESGTVTLDLWSQSEKGTTVTAEATVWLPSSA